jgi:hypothetical protein
VNFVLSAIAPKLLQQLQQIQFENKLCISAAIKKPTWVPMTEPIEVPYIGYPIAQNATLPIQNPLNFHYYIVFFDLVNPVSTSVKPACMKTLKFRRLIPTF